MATQAVTPGSPAGCAIDSTETAGCSAEFYSANKQTYFSSDQASKDLGFLIQNYSPTKTNIIVYGVSYGTLWLTRFAQNFPSLANGLVFDSVVNSYGNNIMYFDNWV